MSAEPPPPQHVSPEPAAPQPQPPELSPGPEFRSDGRRFVTTRQPTPSGLFSPDGQWWWDGHSWRQASPDRRWWWDGRAWMPIRAKRFIMPDATGGAIGLGCISLVVGFLAFFFAGGDLQQPDPGFAAVLGGIGIVLGLAAAVWIFVRKGRLALYGWPVGALAIGVLVTALALCGGLTGGSS